MKRKVKYWVSAFDNSEAQKKNPKAPKIRLILQDPDTKEEWDGAVFLKKAKSGLIYLSGEFQENEPIDDENAPIIKNMFNEDVMSDESEENSIDESEENSEEKNPDEDGPF